VKIEILGTESLGVRGICCFVETRKRKILIDPGVALGYTRFGLLPHPFQVAVDERIQNRIIKRWTEATDIIISHFHGDHTPLVDANPYQLNIKKVVHLNPDVRIWTKDISHLSPLEEKRAKFIFSALAKKPIMAEGKSKGEITFSGPVFHGDKDFHTTTVIMTRIKEDKVFVHAPGIQLLNDEAVSQIIAWHPDIAIVDGPPLYLSKRLSKDQIDRAWHNAKRLSYNVGTLILDHHLMRSLEGIKWIKRLSYKTGRRIMCGADFMGKKRMLLEALREDLYRDMPVGQHWHERYAQGKANTKDYWRQGKIFLQNLKK